MTEKQWQELECVIDNIETFKCIYNHFSPEAKGNFALYTKDMISIGLDDMAGEWRIDQLGESVDTLKKLQEMEDSQKLQFAPELMCSLLQSYIIHHVEECKYMTDNEEKKDDSSDSDSMNVSINTDGGNGGPCCILL